MTAPTVPGTARAAVARAALGAVAPLPRPAHRAAAALVDAGISAVLGEPGPVDGWRHHALGLGAAERRAGRALDRVEAAIRHASMSGLRHLRTSAPALGLSPPALLAAVDSAFAFGEALMDVIAEGHRAAADHGDRRPKLLRDLLSGSVVCDLVSRAEAAGWPVPDRVTAVVSAGHVEVPAGALDRRVLADPDATPFRCLCPEDLVAGTAEVLGADGVGIGLPVPVREARRSLRYAEEVLDLVGGGGQGAGVVRAEDHLGLLVARRGAELSRVVGWGSLRPLLELGRGSRAKLVKTLEVGLDVQWQVGRMAQRLGVCTGTVRYRTRQLDDLIGVSTAEADDLFVWKLFLHGARGGA